MKIVLVSTFEKHGGAAIACNRLNDALRIHGIDARMLVLYKTSNDPYVAEISSNKYAKKFKLLVERLGIFVKNGFNKKDLFALSTATTGFDISNHPWVKEADIVNLHWVNQGLLSQNGIAKLVSQHIKLVWTMHDMWPITGLCHCATTCTSYQHAACNMCLPLHYKGKSASLYSPNIQYVTVSNWLAKKANLSYNSIGSTVIGNVIDCNHFCKKSTKFINPFIKTWNLPIDKKIIVMGAADLTTHLKGMELLIKAFKLLDNSDAYHLVLFGGIKGDSTDFLSQLSLPYTYLGNVDYSTLPLIYSCADLVVVPSYYETFGQTISEAMACECPAVAFDSGGQSDIISHLNNGYLARAWEPADLANGINWVLFEADYDLLCKKSRQHILNHFSSTIIAQKYIKLYKKL